MGLLPEGIQWADYYQVLALVDPEPDDHRDSLDYACSNIAGFTERLRLNSGSECALNWMIAQLHPLLKDGLERQGNEWSEVVPLLREMDMVFDLEPALKDPRNILAKLAPGPVKI